MSSDESTRTPDTRDRREAVREKAERVRVRQARGRVVKRAVLSLGVVAAVAAVAVVITWTVSGAAGEPRLAPENSAEDGFTVATITGTVQGTGASLADAAPTPTESAAGEKTKDAKPSPSATATAAGETPGVDIRVYLDYLSPGAREWQVANAQQLASWVGQDAVTLSYHPVSILTAKSNGSKYSLRAASAAACVATYSPETFFSFNNELLTRQPEVDSAGFDDKELASLAIASGSDDPETIRTCVEEESFTSWAKDATERAVAGIPDAGGLALTATPMILVNGQQYVGALDDPAEFAQFVLTTASTTFYDQVEESATPTATPTPAPTKVSKD